MKKKKIILLSATILLLAGGWYGYTEFYRKNTDMSTARPDLQMTASGLISQFEKDEKAANKTFLTKKEFVLAVTGPVKEVAKDEKGFYTVVLGDSGSLSSVRCAMDTLHQQGVALAKRGKPITIQGAITGFNKDEMLGSDVILNRCVVLENKQ